TGACHFGHHRQHTLSRRTKRWHTILMPCSRVYLRQRHSLIPLPDHLEYAPTLSPLSNYHSPGLVSIQTDLGSVSDHSRLGPAGTGGHHPAWLSPASASNTPRTARSSRCGFSAMPVRICARSCPRSCADVED